MAGAKLDGGFGEGADEGNAAGDASLGAPVEEFGEFVLTRAGLAHKSKTLAWGEVGGAELKDGRVSVTDRAGWTWASELHGFVPNAHVLLALVKEFRE